MKKVIALVFFISILACKEEKKQVENETVSEEKIALKPISDTDLENAVKEVVFSTTATTITEEKFFSLTIGPLN